MRNARDQEDYEFTNEGKTFLESVNKVNRNYWELMKPSAGVLPNSIRTLYKGKRKERSWMISDNEEDDFLKGKISAPLPDFPNEEEEE